MTPARAPQQRPLCAADLLPRGPLRRIGKQIFVFDEIDSTNAFLLARTAELPDGAVAWTEYQTAGRGRQGRRWLAPRGSSILVSALLIEPPDSPLAAHAAMLAALAACEAIEDATDCRPALRWPNDLVLNGRKLGGVLAEATPLAALPGQSGTRRAVAIGIGLNCLQQRGHFDGELAAKATSLEIESARVIDRAALAAALLDHLDQNMERCVAPGDGWLGLRAAWRKRCHDFGARVTLRHDAQAFQGTVVDIGEEGDLFVQLENGGRRRFAAATTTRIW